MINTENLENESILIDLQFNEYSDFLNYLKNNLSSPIDKSQLDIYFMALNKRIPKEWDFLLKEFKLSLDPDYAIYLKLKSKFEK